MNYDALINELKELLAKCMDDMAKNVLREIYATGLRDGQEIKEWK